MISWLHLSDMHINANTSFDQNVIHDALRRDLESQLSIYKIELNFIFFTGDVAYTASREDYKLAIAFFSNLCNTLNFNQTNLFIVPGNHDVDRYKVSNVGLSERHYKNSTRRFYDGPRKFLKDIESLGNDDAGYFEAKLPDRILRNLTAGKRQDGC